MVVLLTLLHCGLTETTEPVTVCAKQYEQASRTIPDIEIVRSTFAF